MPKLKVLVLLCLAAVLNYTTLENYVRHGWIVAKLVLSRHYVHCVIRLSWLVTSEASSCKDSVTFFVQRRYLHSTRVVTAIGLPTVIIWF